MRKISASEERVSEEREMDAVFFRWKTHHTAVNDKILALTPLNDGILTPAISLNLLKLRKLPIGLPAALRYACVSKVTSRLRFKFARSENGT